jgi:hypothetical protein
MGAEERLAAQGQLGDPEALTARLFRDMAGALELLTVYLGERLGLYRARAARWLPEVVAAMRGGGGPPPLPWAPEGRPEFNRAVFLNLLKAAMLRFYRLTP